MQNANYLRDVKEHYESYPYPPRPPEREKTELRMPVMDSLDQLNHLCFSGKKNFFAKDFRVLVAGAGTGDSVIYLAEQLRDSAAEVVYLDMSLASMKIAKERARVRQLENITWINDSLLNIPAIDIGLFDHISCSGVLHHLENPALGLKALSSALKPDGVMGIMIYAKYGRMAVYQMQEVLRIINRDEEDMQKKIANCKAILDNLPATNWLHSSPQNTKDEPRKYGDIGIYDLYLHAKDLAYSIPELYDYVEGGGLHIIKFVSEDLSLGDKLYNPICYLNDKELESKVSRMEIKEQQALAELLNGKIYKHNFYAAQNIPELPRPDDLDMVPVLGSIIHDAHRVILEAIDKSPEVILFKELRTNISVTLHKTPNMAKIFSYIDGKATLAEIIEKVGSSPDAILAEFKYLFSAFHTYGLMFLRHKSTPPYPYSPEFQGRVTKLYSAAS